MTILQLFRFYLFFEGYFPEKGCVFEPILNWQDLCHLKNNTQTNAQIIQKSYDCELSLAEIILDFPLFNVVPGSKKWNGTDNITFKRGDFQDVIFISNKVIRAAKAAIVDYIDLMDNEKFLSDVEDYLKGLVSLLEYPLEDRVFYYRKLVLLYRRNCGFI